MRLLWSRSFLIDVLFYCRFWDKYGCGNWCLLIERCKIFELVTFILVFLFVCGEHLGRENLHRGLLLTHGDDVTFDLTPKIHVTVLAAANNVVVAGRQ